MSIPNFDIQISIVFDSPSTVQDNRRSRKILTLQSAFREKPEELEKLMNMIKEILLREPY